MNIQEAVISANKQGKFMYRETWKHEGNEMEIMPTNTQECCMVIPTKDKTMTGSRWNPDMDDLISNDWEVD